MPHCFSPTIRSRKQPALAAVTLSLATLACQPAAPRVLQITGTDYAFAVPPKVQAGPATIRFANNGKVPHEMALGRLRTGMTADSVMTRIAEGRDPGDVTDGVVGILIVEPGQSSIGGLQTDLLAGRTYVMICQFRDADSLPPHIAMGMQASFTVE